MLVATFAALSAAALFAVATALQHRSAGLVTGAGPLPTRGLSRFVYQTVRHPLWIVGSVADLGGLGLHALALRDGPLTLVQPLLVTGVVFALPLRQLIEGLRPRRDELRWAVMLAVGLVLFLAISTPAKGAAQGADPIPSVVCVVAIGLGIFGCAIAGRRSTGATAALALGLAAGLAFAATAGLLKEVMDTLNRGVGVLFVTWPLYALVAVGAIGLLLNQLAFQAGPLRFSLPAITTIDPIVSLIIGVAVFDEKYRNGAPYLLGETIGLALIVAAAVGLTRSDPDHPKAPIPQSPKGQSFPHERPYPIPGPVASISPAKVPDSPGRR
jgi:lysylphosphatidylglycerol synthetase-like protein (DUF2156 family)